MILILIDKLYVLYKNSLIRIISLVTEDYECFENHQTLKILDKTETNSTQSISYTTF